MYRAFLPWKLEFKLHSLNHINQVLPNRPGVIWHPSVRLSQQCFTCFLSVADLAGRPHSLVSNCDTFKV